MPSQPTDVVVTGVGALASIGIGIDAFWVAMQDGVSGIGSLEFRDDDGPKPPFGWQNQANAGHWVGGPLIGFDAAQYVRPRKALKVMGRELQTAFADAPIKLNGRIARRDHNVAGRRCGEPAGEAIGCRDVRGIRRCMDAQLHFASATPRDRARM